MFRTIMAALTCLTLALPVLSAERVSGEQPPGAKGPLAALPSTPGAHIGKLKALGEDLWLALGKPAPDLKGAFICGPGVHGGTHKYPDGTTRYENDDCAADQWLPAKTLDAVKPSGCWSGFYVPELNVHIYHESGDSRPTKRILAYRLKNVPGK